MTCRLSATMCVGQHVLVSLVSIHRNFWQATKRCLHLDSVLLRILFVPFTRAREGHFASHWVKFCASLPSVTSTGIIRDNFLMFAGVKPWLIDRFPKTKTDPGSTFIDGNSWNVLRVHQSWINIRRHLIRYISFSSVYISDPPSCSFNSIWSQLLCYECITSSSKYFATKKNVWEFACVRMEKRILCNSFHKAVSLINIYIT